MTIFRFILILHIAGGTLGLLGGSIMLVLKKGTRRHRRIGRLYVSAMLVAAFSSLVLALMHPNYFLFIVGIFTAYLVLSGRRYIRWPHRGGAQYADWCITGLMMLFSLLFLAYGTYMLIDKRSFGLVMIVFGAISMLMVLQDYRNFTGRTNMPGFWLSTHLQRMTASYIASATAFIVVNNAFFPPLVAWLAPTVVLTPLIFYWTKKYRKHGPPITHAG